MLKDPYNFEFLDLGPEAQERDLDYHLKLRRFVVVDLKIGAFRPEDAGKMNFYLAAVDDQVRREEALPSIGLILCKQKNRVVVEYALHDMGRPIGVAEYRLMEQLPEELRGSFPTTEELERELSELRTQRNDRRGRRSRSGRAVLTCSRFRRGWGRTSRAPFGGRRFR